jgi:hypothetical protein
MKVKRSFHIMVAVLLVVCMMPAAVLAKGPPEGHGEETAVNNLSFPAIAVDGFSITPLINASLTAVYTGEYPGLTEEEITYLEANGPWYPQKTDGNVWQADFVNQGTEDVTYIDWGDNIESVNPKVRTPFRLEVTLYKALEIPMSSYTMAVLEFPSSSNELQGTNNIKYDNYYATVISASPELVIQYLGAAVPTLVWDPDEDQWYTTNDIDVIVYPPVIPVSFAPELNVGGKYIFGASEGGWKPTQTGYYRITFYVPTGSGVNLTTAIIANASTGFSDSGEGTAAMPLIDTENNLTYVDVLVKGAGGGRH